MSGCVGKFHIRPVISFLKRPTNNIVFPLVGFRSFLRSEKSGVEESGFEPRSLFLGFFPQSPQLSMLDLTAELMLHQGPQFQHVDSQPLMRKIIT